MKEVLILGGGLAGCAVAKELSAAGIASYLVEKDAKIGGKVRGYGCKADTKCNNCGLCAVGSLWQDVENDPKITAVTGTEIADLSKREDGFRALLQTGKDGQEKDFQAVVVATGFEDAVKAAGAGFDRARPEYRRVFSGSALESLLLTRGSETLFEEAPGSVGFLLCYGSRSRKERAAYCSQVCCGYATRTAKVVRQYYPEAEIVLFYMDLQAVNPGNYAEELAENGIRTIRCRPAEISFDGAYPVVAYEEANGKQQRRFDVLFLCGGIHPDIPRNTALADITGLKVKGDGFLDYVNTPEETGICLAGAAKRPMSITETLADARRTAAGVIAMVKNTPNFPEEVPA
jgi:heterodisulfide reductase subunit A